MGVLSNIRIMMNNIIEHSYCAGQLYGEMKKIKDSRRQKLISSVTLESEQKREIDQLFKTSYGKSIRYDWHRLYQSFTGKFDACYFPEYLFSSKLEPKMNAADYRHVLDDKLLLPLFCVGIANVRTPRTLLTISETICFDKNKNLINIKKSMLEIGGVTS